MTSRADDMNVLMTADAVGGVWTYTIELARALRPLGVRTTLATLGPAPSADQRRAAEAVDGLDLRVSTYRLEWMDDPWDDVERSRDWIAALAHEVRPDVVHLNGCAHGSLALPAPKVGRMCSLITDSFRSRVRSASFRSRSHAVAYSSKFTASTSGADHCPRAMSDSM